MLRISREPCAQACGLHPPLQLSPCAPLKEGKSPAGEGGGASGSASGPSPQGRPTPSLSLLLGLPHRFTRGSEYLGRVGEGRQAAPVQAPPMRGRPAAPRDPWSWGNGAPSCSSDRKSRRR